MALSRDPKARARQLANLRPGAGAWKEGATPRVVHGLRSRRPAKVLLGEAAADIVASLELQVPLRGADGEVLPHFVTAIETAALQLVIIRRALGFLQTHGWDDGRGHMRPEVEGVERALARLRRHLQGLGATPEAYSRLGFEVAATDRIERQAAAERAARLTDDELDARLAGLDALAGPSPLINPDLKTDINPDLKTEDKP